ncbi:hypothetical protein F4818DRAFT_310234 [Hypoxylon cercidicola]|nr:hypothetical protein F4818DRAFT_310234 [Hypoxylon cercidicola]
MTRVAGEYHCRLGGDAIIVNFVPTDAGAHNPQELSITFQRTIRVPDNAGTSQLPPGLGRFPLFKVRDYASRLPPEMTAKGGVFLPMYQTEAMWIRFTANSPFMIKIYAGGVNVVSGEHSTKEDTIETKLRRLKLMDEKKSIQDYLVVPDQLWIDGMATSPGIVSQFVAMPMGEGYSVEAQLTGKEVVGGLQFEITPTIPEETMDEMDRRYRKAGLPTPDGNFSIDIMSLTRKVVPMACSPSDSIASIKNGVLAKEGIPPSHQIFYLDGKEPQELEDGRTLSDYNIQKGSTVILQLNLWGHGSGMPSVPMGIAAGGRIKQEIRWDFIRASRWNRDTTYTIPVQILNTAAFRRVTGRNPPPCPVNASTYAAAGLPFFKLYEEPSGIAGDFAAVQSVNQIEQNRGVATGSDASVHPRLVALDSRGDGITVPSLATLSIHDPDSLLNPAGPLRPFRAREDLVKELRDERDNLGTH